MKDLDSMIENADLDWQGVSEAMARQILQQAEIAMQAQWQAAIAADQRAVTSASIFVAVATAGIGGALAYWHESKEAAVLVASLVGCAGLILAAALCFWSARPVEFFAAGNQPDQWWGCRHEDLVTCIGGETENYQFRISQNAKRLKKNGAIFSIGVVIALAAPLLSVMAWLIISFCGRPL